MATLQIIVGTSFFSGAPCVGIALKGQNDSSAIVRWAESIKGSCGRPAAVETLNGYKSEEQAIARLRERWTEWAAKSGVHITIVRKERRNVGRF